MWKFFKLKKSQNPVWIRLMLPLLATMFFTSNPSFMKKLMPVLDPVVILLYVQCISVILFFFFLGALPELKKALKESRHRRLSFLLFCLFSGLLAPLFQIFGVKFTTVVNVSLLANSYALFLIIASILFFKERLQFHRLTGLVVLFLGVVVIVFEGDFRGIDFKVGDFLVIGAQLMWVVADVLYKKNLNDIHPDVAILGRNLLSISILFFLVLFLAPDFSWEVDKSLMPFLLGIAVFPILLGQSFWYKSMKICSGMSLSMVSLTAPIFGIIFACLLLGENIYVYHYWGGAFILMGLIISRIKPDGHLFHKVHHIKHVAGSGA